MPVKAAILLNGPPRAGKNTTAEGLAFRLPYPFRFLQVGRILKELTHTLYGIPEIPWDAFEVVKDWPRPEFGGLTPRQAYIDVSENHLKPMHGDDFLGRLLVEEMMSSREEVCIIDVGFPAEATAVVEAVGSANTLLVRIHATEANGAERGFDGDSRGYIRLDGVETADLWNHWGRQNEFIDAVKERVAAFIALRLNEVPVAFQPVPV